MAGGNSTADEQDWIDERSDLATSDFDFGLPQFGDDLLSCVAFSRHSPTPCRHWRRHARQLKFNEVTLNCCQARLSISASRDQNLWRW